jgi:archaellum component FlaC
LKICTIPWLSNTGGFLSTTFHRDLNWKDFLEEFMSSVSRITGRVLEVEPISRGSDTIIEQELESLRTKVEELSDEVNMHLSISYSISILI